MDSFLSAVKLQSWLLTWDSLGWRTARRAFETDGMPKWKEMRKTK
jgi:hypothetical protein